MAEISGKKLLPLMGLAGVAFFGLALFVAQDLGGPARANRERLTLDGGVGAEIMSEAARVEYLKTRVKVEDFKVGPEFKPGTDEQVPGVLRVEGAVKNAGDRVLHEVTLSVLTKDEAGSIISTFQQKVIEGGALQPGETRAFRLRIPDRPQYKDFGHQLR